MKAINCPFCDGDGIAVTDATRLRGVWFLDHRCPIVGFMEVSGATREVAIGKWNTRAQAAPGEREIDDAMVERAVEAWHENTGLLDDVLRAVLTAALTTSTKGEE